MYHSIAELDEAVVDVFKDTPNTPSETGCLTWGGRLDSKGYGTIVLRLPSGRTQGTGAHRLSYMLHVGEIPQGFQIDHLCRNRACVNPQHLEPVTQGENIRRSPRCASIACKNGHDLSGDNLRVDYVPDSSGTPRRRRTCRACLREARARHRARLRTDARSA